MPPKPRYPFGAIYPRAGPDAADLLTKARAAHRLPWAQAQRLALAARRRCIVRVAPIPI